MSKMTVANDDRLRLIQNEIDAVLNRQFTGYLSDAIALGNKLFTVDRILRDRLIVEATGVKLVDVDAEEEKEKSQA